MVEGVLLKVLRHEDTRCGTLKKSHFVMLKSGNSHRLHRLLICARTVLFTYVIPSSSLLTKFDKVAISDNGTNFMLGSYRSTIPPFGPYSGFKECEIGFFCANGVKAPCPAGSFGNAFGLSDILCSGYCFAGYFCPAGSIVGTSIACGSSDLYCPIHTLTPNKVPMGYYSIDTNNLEVAETIAFRAAVIICPIGYYCERGLRYSCAAGKYGLVDGLSSPECSGLCPEGECDIGLSAD